MRQARFIVLPGDNRYNVQMHTASLDVFPGGFAAIVGGRMASTGARATAGAAEAPLRAARELGRIGDNEALLVSLDDNARLALQGEYPGLRVICEGTARVAMLQFDLRPTPSGGMAGVAGVHKDFTVTVTDPLGRQLKGVRVFALTDVSTVPPTGAESRTDAHGVARIPLPSST